jgi:hypothetical protein
MSTDLTTATSLGGSGSRLLPWPFRALKVTTRPLGRNFRLPILDFGLTSMGPRSFDRGKPISSRTIPTRVEYARRVEDAYRRVREAKTGLTSLTKTTSKRQFDDVNKLIDGYNSARADLARVEVRLAAPLVAKYPALSRIGSSDVKAQQESSVPSGEYTV